MSHCVVGDGTELSSASGSARHGINIGLDGVEPRVAVAQTNQEVEESIAALEKQKGRQLFHNLHRESSPSVVTALLDRKCNTHYI